MTYNEAELLIEKHMEMSKGKTIRKVNDMDKVIDWYVKHIEWLKLHVDPASKTGSESKPSYTDKAVFELGEILKDVTTVRELV